MELAKPILLAGLVLSSRSTDVSKKYSIEEKLLEERKAQSEEIKLQVEQWMNGIPVRMQRIIRYKFFEGMSWERVADRIGRKATGDSIRMEFNNFMRAA